MNTRTMHSRHVKRCDTRWPQTRAMRQADSPYRRKDTRPSGKHPSDKWLLVMFAVTAVILWVWP